MVRSVPSLLVLGAAALLSVASASSTPPPGGPAPGVAPSVTPPPPAPDGTYQAPQVYRFQGGHPVHPDFGTGYCRETGAHPHDYAPFEPELFTIAGGVWIFIGDPGDFDNEGELYWYANPHPIPGGDEECWCYYPWPHRHDFAIDQEGFDAIGGIIYFVGEFTAGFHRQFEHKRDFFRRHYRRSYLRGSLYRRHHPRYERLGPGRYRLNRNTRPFVAYRPGRPQGSGPYTHAPDRTFRPGRRGSAADLRARPPITRGLGVRVRDPAHGAWPPTHVRSGGRSGARRWFGASGSGRGGRTGLFRSGSRRGTPSGVSTPAPPARRSSSRSSSSRGSGGGSRRR